MPPIKKKCPQLKILEIPLIRLPPNLKKMPPIIKKIFPNSTNTFEIKKKCPQFYKKMMPSIKIFFHIPLTYLPPI